MELDSTAGEEFLDSWRSSTYPPRATSPPENKGLIAGLIKGKHWLISPDHKAGYFWGGTLGGGRLTSHDGQFHLNKKLIKPNLVGG